MVIQGARGATFIDLKNEKTLHSYFFKEEDISSEQIFHQDQYLLLQGRGAVDLWEISSGKKLQSWRDPDTNAQATAVSQSGRLIFTGQYVRQLQDNTATWAGNQFRTLFSTNVHAILSAAAFSADERWLATGGIWDNRVILWDIASGKDITSWLMEQHVTQLSFSPDNQYLYVSTYTQWVAYELASLTEAFTITHPVSGGAEYLPAHNALLIVSDEGNFRLLSAPTGEVLWSYQAGQHVEDWNHYPQEDLALKLANNEIVVIDVSSGQLRLRFQAPFEVIGPLDVSADGSLLAAMVVSEFDWEVALWQLPK
jgi:WD40 repeat protein